jgi:cytidylate kinase
LVAAALGFRYLDEEIVLAAAEKEGLDPEQLARVEHKCKGLSRLEVDIVTGGAFDEIQRSLIRAAVREAAEAGKVVIVAHVASIALAGDDRVLRVIVHGVTRYPCKASLADRANRRARGGQTDRSRRQGARMAYIKRFYAVDRELPSLYDLVVSTDRLSASDACALALDAAAALNS